MLPYRLVLASHLAEHGLVEAAAQQASAVTAALNALGGKLPGGLLRTRMQANELCLRLQRHAQVIQQPSSRAPITMQNAIFQSPLPSKNL